MPNHCSQILEFSNNSKKSLVKAIKPYLSVGANKEPFLDFEKILPMPEGIKKVAELSSIDWVMKNMTEIEKQEMQETVDALKEENEKKYGYKDWYDWSCGNWGTKWNSYGNRIEEEAPSQIFFETAWAPAIPVIDKLAKLLKEDLRLAYLDEGHMFIGEYFAHANGEGEDISYSDVSAAPESLREELGVVDYDEDEEDDD
jgi:Ferredoxin-like domain in Api92-like protein